MWRLSWRFHLECAKGAAVVSTSAAKAAAWPPAGDGHPGSLRPASSSRWSRSLRAPASRVEISASNLATRRPVYQPAMPQSAVSRAVKAH